jgi:two-component system cell cycle sensor histidine kinase PleC
MESNNFFNKLIFIILFVSSLVYIFYFHVQWLGNARVKSVEHDIASIVQSYRSNIWNNNPATSIISQGTIQDWTQNNDFINLLVSTLNYYKDLNVVQMAMYNDKGQKFLNLSDYEVVIDKDGNGVISKLMNSISFSLFSPQNLAMSFTSARSGQNYSQVIPSAIFHTNDSPDLKRGSLVQVAIPIFSTDNQVKAVVEVFYDITDEWNQFNGFTFTSIGGMVLLFALFISILFYNEVKHQRLLEQQHEANSALVEAKAKAEEDSRAKSQFLANVSHELRTPLNAIIGFSDVIKNETYGPITVKEYNDYINDINNSGNHLLSLINDILDFSKAEADKLDVEKTEIDIKKIMGNSIRLVKPRAEEAKVNLVEDFPAESVVLIADPKRMKQAILNLLSNSVKFTPENGSVTLKGYIDKEAGRFIIQVIDTGIGIAEQDISKAMSSFGQVDSKLSKRYAGTGLGLPLTKKLVELMGGKFDIKSQIGFGTTISLSFPYSPSV